ncbi:unnamed protein product, partial [Prorocentrum cordatum]
MYFWSAGPLGPPRAAPPHPAPMADAPGEEAGAGSAVPPRKGPRVSWVLPEDALPAVAEELAPAALDEGPPTLRVRLGIPRVQRRRWRPRPPPARPPPPSSSSPPPPPPPSPPPPSPPP